MGCSTFKALRSKVTLALSTTKFLSKCLLCIRSFPILTTKLRSFFVVYNVSSPMRYCILNSILRVLLPKTLKSNY